MQTLGYNSIHICVSGDRGIRAVLKQQLDHPLVAHAGGDYQRNGAVADLQVDIRAVLKQQLDHSLVAGRSGTTSAV